jgi:hypothetical protein
VGVLAARSSFARPADHRGSPGLTGGGVLCWRGTVAGLGMWSLRLLMRRWPGTLSGAFFPASPPRANLIKVTY